MHNGTSLYNWSLLIAVDKLKCYAPFHTTYSHLHKKCCNYYNIRSVRLHWDVTSYALLDANDNWEENYET